MSLWYARNASCSFNTTHDCIETIFLSPPHYWKTGKLRVVQSKTFPWQGVLATEVFFCYKWSIFVTVTLSVHLELWFRLFISGTERVLLNIKTSNCPDCSPRQFSLIAEVAKTLSPLLEDQKCASLLKLTTCRAGFDRLYHKQPQLSITFTWSPLPQQIIIWLILFHCKQPKHQLSWFHYLYQQGLLSTAVQTFVKSLHSK